MRIALPFLLLASLPALSQKIKSSQWDAANKVWRVETAPVVLKGSGESRTEVALRAAGDSLFLRLAGGAAHTLVFGDRLIFLFEDDSTLTLASTGLQPAERKGYGHEYPLTTDDLALLSRHDLQAFRKYATEGPDDVYPDKSNADALRKLSAVFLDELKKQPALKPATAAATPGFPGGRDVLLRFFNRNLKPLAGLATGERKFLTIAFGVGADGSIRNPEVKHRAGEPFDAEALRMVQRMPRWKPARRGGQAVAATVQQPLTFVQTADGLRIFF